MLAVLRVSLSLPTPYSLFRLSVECSHGFAWEEGSDVNTHILPLYHFVRNVNKTESGGYYGK